MKKRGRRRDPAAGSSGGPRERSGPIGISSGDFSTPWCASGRRRSRAAFPVSGNRAPAPSLDEPVTAATSGSAGARDEDEGAGRPLPSRGRGRSRVRRDAGARGGGLRRRTGRDADPPAATAVQRRKPVWWRRAGARLDIDAEAAALAAEAAAVRALDSGPLTPPPELVSSPSPEASPRRSQTRRRLPPEVAAAPLTPAPAVEADAHAPAGGRGDENATTRGQRRGDAGPRRSARSAGRRRPRSRSCARLRPRS